MVHAMLISLSLMTVAETGVGADGPANQWAKCASRTGAAWGNNMVWCPTRKQVLHYTAWTVLAFDPVKAEWVADYAWPGKKKPTSLSRHNSVAAGGRGSLSAEGMPSPAMTINGLCWDSKRQRMVMTMAGLTCAYDPETRKWADLGAKTLFNGAESAGGPPVYGLSTCYDPVNDEILLFSHWTGTANPDRLGVDDRTSGHLGTWRFTYTDKTWRRAGDTFGGDEVKAKRKALREQIATLSKELDAAYVERARLRLHPEEARGDHQARLDALTDRLRTGRDRLWTLDAQLRNDLRVEPPPRTGAPLVYDSKNQAIVLFGGYTGLYRTDLANRAKHAAWRTLNDTWIYDCKTRQWRALNCKRRPPRQHAPMVTYDPASGLVVLVTLQPGSRSAKRPARAVVWTLDVAKAEWSKRGEHDWPTGVISRGSGQGSEGPKPYVPLQMLGHDPERNLLVITQPEKGGPATYTLALDLGKQPSEPAPEWTTQPPMTPQVIPPDDLAVVAKLATLPANTWVDAKAGPRGPGRRDWGNAAVDPVRGHVYYFGGGHSTYQIRDVAIYAPGVNKWVYAPGDHNDFIPWAGWGGMGLGYFGGPAASHQRNTYFAIDGRMFKSVGGWTKLNRGDMIPRGRKPGPRYAHFYDVDRGGVWRRVEIPEKQITRGENVDGVWSAVHVVDPGGRILGIVGDRTQYYGSTYPNVYVSIYDVYKNTLEIRNTGKPHPERVGESRPFCYLTGKNRILFQEHAYNRRQRKIVRERTWVYDIAGNKWIDLKPKRQPETKPDTVLYIPEQDAVLLLRSAGRSKAAQWVYSFKHNTWAPLPFQGGPLSVGSPYGQVVYAQPYGILVGVAGRTTLMRPDFSTVKWE